ncbi:diguanylate cyclase [Methylobacter sp.]|uniref:GGDEF domain-containing protein n=1 Tax=Methylobacter sp. TaxID=2051955 RepID=UPI0025EF4A6C|nr:diguanylate cyclase [Methylobacter sp.]
MLWPCACLADAKEIVGSWYQAPEDWTYDGQADLAATGLKSVAKVALIGGHFFQQADLDINTAGRHVLDFKNTTTIGYFRHIILDAQRHPVADLQGGILSSELNPFFLRHGREVDLPVGHYRLLTELNSPFFLAGPQPYLDTLDAYRQAIKPGNALTLLCLGMFLGLMIYYAALAIARWNLSAAMYSFFILGNLLYNGMALLVFAELFDMHWFYLVSIPILFSNCSYILFVMSLLKIQRDTYPRLYNTGAVALALLVGLIVLAAVMPHWSLEIDRYGVGLFLLYGLVAGIIQSLEGNVISRLYLCAIGTFFVLGITTISANSLNSYGLYIEHMGLFSVAVEVMLLALVLSYQFAQLYREKEYALECLEHSNRIARTDTLTGLPNRIGLDLTLEILPQHGSLTFIDMDGLKYYNDQFGHERGDELLRVFAWHLNDRLRGRAEAYRLGGDEFAITCEQGDVPWVETMLAKAIEDMRAGGFNSAGASFGSAYVYEATSKEKLKHMADCRMYENKRLNKRSRYEDQNYT